MKTMFGRMMLLAAALALVAAACGDDVDNTAATAPTTTATAPTTTLDSGRDDIDEGSAEGGVVITEVVFEEHVTLTNTGSEVVDLSGLWLCNRPNYVQAGEGSLLPGDSIDIDASSLGGLPAGGGEVAFYTSSSFGDSSAMIDYVAWGGGGGRLAVAEQAGIWPSGGAVSVSGASISAPSGGAGPDDWS